MKQNLTFNHICRIVIFFFFISKTNGASGRTIAVVNDCGFTVWPGIYSDDGFNITGFELTTGNSRSFQTPPYWSGSLWGRTGCTFNGSGHGSCKTGDCGSGEMECNGRSPTPPVTLAGFEMFGDAEADLYNVNVINGYNLKMTVKPTSSDCLKMGCVYDLNNLCPEELRLEGGGGCNTTCQHCCYSSIFESGSCKPKPYSPVFNLACPGSYYSLRDDGNWMSPGYKICHNGNYTVKFCPPFDYSTIKVGNHLNYDEQLVSATGNFTLGFFNNDDYRWYLGIWYTGDVAPQKVWVANPNNPILLPSILDVALTIDQNTGNLIITDGSGTTLMTLTHVQAGPKAKVTATLEDTGNFRLINEINNTILWQSFDHPTNVLLPGMKLGYNMITGQNWILTSWFIDDSFDSGAFTLSWEAIHETSHRLITPLKF